MHEAAQAALLQQLTKLTHDLGEPASDRNPVIVNSTPRRIIFFLSRIPLREARPRGRSQRPADQSGVRRGRASRRRR